MFKYLLLKSIYDLSDVDVVERSKYDMSFKYFLDMAPEDEVINPSSLTKISEAAFKGYESFGYADCQNSSVSIRKRNY